MSTDKIDNLKVTDDLQSKNLITNALVTNFFKVTNINPSLVVRTGTNPNQSNTNIGTNAGLTNQQSGAIAIGINAGQNSQNTDAIAIGLNCARSNQGALSVAIGNDINQSGPNNITIGNNNNSINVSNTISIGNQINVQNNNTLFLNALGSLVNTTTGPGVFIRPIRPSGTGTQFTLFYDPLSQEITYFP